MNETDFAAILTEALDAQVEDDCSELKGFELSIDTFAAAGLLTGNHGLVVRIGGDEFQLQIVQSKSAPRTRGQDPDIYCGRCGVREVEFTIGGSEVCGACADE